MGGLSSATCSPEAGIILLSHSNKFQTAIHVTRTISLNRGRPIVNGKRLILGFHNLYSFLEARVL